MSRVTLMRITLDISGRWIVAGIDDSRDGADVPALRDPRTKGAAYLPATSLAGSLRRHLGEDLGMDQANHWLGDPPPGWEEQTTEDAEGDGGEGRGSVLRFLGVQLGADMSVKNRGTTAVNRRSGAALGRSLRTEQWVPGGEATVYAEHPGSFDDDLCTSLLTWRPVIGRSRTTGLGSARVTAVEALTLDLTNADHLTWWLTGRAGWFDPDADVPEMGERWTADPKVLDAALAIENEPGWRLEVTWRVKERIHVGYAEPSVRTGENYATAETFKIGSQPTIPGSSWKGVYRSGIGHVLACCGALEAQRDAVISRLFGDTMCRGILSFSDSVIHGDDGMGRRTHAPIDRFTGGAADSLLHTVASIREGVEFAQIITASEELGPAVENLVRHVIRDLTDGYRGVGRGSSRGYGWVTAKSLAVNGQSQSPPDEPKAVDLTAILAECAAPALMRTERDS
jgi:CRISPR/Cas system CSM-associated protein Csm3 (group 7 of RAMP superfamily)